MIEHWKIEGYLGVMLSCCQKWREQDGKTFLMGWDDQKLLAFYELWGPESFPKFKPIFDKIKREISDNKLETLLEEYCRLIPEEYRAQAFDRCKTIVDKKYYPRDKYILSQIEKFLPITVQDGVSAEL